MHPAYSVVSSSRSDTKRESETTITRKQLFDCEQRRKALCYNNRYLSIFRGNRHDGGQNIVIAEK